MFTCSCLPVAHWLRAEPKDIVVLILGRRFSDAGEDVHVFEILAHVKPLQVVQINPESSIAARLTVCVVSAC